MPSASGSCDLHGHKFRLCDLRSETSCRAEKNPHFPITLAYSKCKYAQGRSCENIYQSYSAKDTRKDTHVETAFLLLKTSKVTKFEKKILKNFISEKLS